MKDDVLHSRLCTALSGAALAALLLAGGGRLLAEEVTIQVTDVPAPVLAAVRKQYPGATQQRWEKDVDKGRTFYEVILRHGQKTLEVKFSPEGKLSVEEELLSLKELPADVRKALAASRYARWKVKKVERVTDHEKGAQVSFEVEVTDGGKDRELLFDLTGKLIGDVEDRD